MTEGMSGNLAIFDLDETLTIRGTWGRFVNYVLLRRFHIISPIIFILTWGSAGLAQLRYKKFGGKREDAKRVMIYWVMRGLPKDKLVQWGGAFAAREVAHGLRPGGKAALTKHRAAGDTLMIISAGSDLVVEPIAKLLDIPHCLCTKSAWEGGRMTTALGSADCYGEEKVTRLKAYFQAHPELKQNHTIITMYSDSYSDLAILRFADVGVAVNPDKRLKAYAGTYSFQIVDWMGADT